MKKILYLGLLILGITSLSSCGTQKSYAEFLRSMETQYPNNTQYRYQNVHTRVNTVAHEDIPYQSYYPKHQRVAQTQNNLGNQILTTVIDEGVRIGVRRILGVNENPYYLQNRYGAYQYNNRGWRYNFLRYNNTPSLWELTNPSERYRITQMMGAAGWRTQW